MSALDEMLEEARRGLKRVAPEDFDAVVEAGALVVDVRPLEVRTEFGELDGALVIGLNVLEWRLAPDSAHRCVDVAADQVVLLVCHQGYSSSLAAQRLQRVGLARATDLIGGHAALLSARSSSARPSGAPLQP